jgi:hypothetical protein
MLAMTVLFITVCVVVLAALYVVALHLDPPMSFHD